jgi:flagellar basal-body rod protein FlgF
MDDLMAIAASGMQHDLLRMGSISQNLANVRTPGYKKQIVVSTPFAQQVDTAMAQLGQGGAPSTLSIDPAAATLRYTGNIQDIAIEGGEFFEVASAQGVAYTRQGGFHTDARGRLVGEHGWPVMGSGGEIVLTGAYTIEANGDVRQGEQVVARLKLTRFDNPAALAPLGGGLYRQGAATVADAMAPARLRLGYQENSNVNSPQEMVRLTETVRHFESLQKIIQGYDDSLEKTIRKLGEF